MSFPSPTVTGLPEVVMEPEILSDQEIDLLLCNAEARLSGHLAGESGTPISNVRAGQDKIPIRYELTHCLAFDRCSLTT